MGEKLCINKTVIIILITLIAIIGIGMAFTRVEEPPVIIQQATPTQYSYQDPKLRSLPPTIITRGGFNPNQIQVRNTQGNPTYNIYPPLPYTVNSPPAPPPVDIISQVDRRKIVDPLLEPTRRLTRDQLPPYYLDQVFSRGLPDNYTLLGTLTRMDEGSNTDRILPLYGRQTYPSSPKWEYYTQTTNLGVNLKVPFEVKQNELFTDDVVTLRDFKNAQYRVSLYKLDSPVYNPFVLY